MSPTCLGSRAGALPWRVLAGLGRAGSKCDGCNCWHRFHHCLGHPQRSWPGGCKHRAVPPPSLDQHFRQQLERHAANYRRRFAEFFRPVSQHASLDLAFLSFRLDFNLFYETSQLHAEAAAADLGPDASPQPGSPMPATP